MHRPRLVPGSRSARLLVLSVIGALALTAVPAAGANGGFTTSVPSMLDPVMAGVQIKPLLTVGEAVGDDGYVFDSIPDGISIDLRGKGRVDAYVNHETSLVPFPGNLSDFNNSQVSRIALNQRSMGVLNARYVITSDSNYQRFCSNFLVGPAQGFDREILFTNEEATDIVNRTGTAWPATPANGSNPEQAGVVVALDIKSGEHRPIYGMGRHNHENSVAIPGYDDLVILSGDDTFSAPASQLYSYIAPDTDAVWNDQGGLWAFKSDDPEINDYGDLSGDDSVSGTFIPVPRRVATGTSLTTTAQTVLENWSNTNDVFQFIRVEDIAYDRNDPNIVYFADTGEPRAVADATTGRLRRGSTSDGPYMNGRIFKMVLDDEDPTVVESLSILIDADTGGYGNRDVIHQPDNIETTANGILIQEDPGSHNHGNDGPTGSTARIWHYDFSDESLDVVAKVNQSQDATAPYDPDTTTAPARPGAWESSGIVDASAAFGPDWFLVDVQAGSLILESEPRGSVVFEREGGQLLAIKIPGA